MKYIDQIWQTVKHARQRAVVLYTYSGDIERGSCIPERVASRHPSQTGGKGPECVIMTGKRREGGEGRGEGREGQLSSQVAVGREGEREGHAERTDLRFKYSQFEVC